MAAAVAKKKARRTAPKPKWRPSGGEGRVSATQLAVKLGVSKVSVSRAIQSGRLGKSVRRVGRRYEIDLVLALEEWNAGRERDPVHNPIGDLEPVGDLPPIPESLPPGGGQLSGPPQLELYDDVKLVDAKKVTEIAKGQLEHIKLERELGGLIEADGARMERFNTARIVRDAVLGVSPRLAPLCAAEMNSTKCEMIIEQALIEALEELARDLTSG